MTQWNDHMFSTLLIVIHSAVYEGPRRRGGGGRKAAHDNNRPAALPTVSVRPTVCDTSLSQMSVLRSVLFAGARGRSAVAVTCVTPRRKSTAAHVATSAAKEGGILESPFGSVNIPNQTLIEYIWNESKHLGNKPAITCGITDRSYTFSECKTFSEHFAWSLVRELQLKKGDVIGLLLPNIPEFAIAIHGSIAAGLSVTFANPLYTAGEISRQFENAGVKCCVTVPQLLNLAKDVTTTLKDCKKTIVVGQNKHENGLLSFKQLMVDAKPVDLPELHPEDVAILPYSSGTTGLPKGVMLTHKNLVSNLEMMKHPDIIDHIPTSDTYQETSLSVLPFFHIYGFNGILNTNMVYGFQHVSMPRFTPEDYIICLEKYKPTMLFVVPSLLLFLASHPSVTRDHLSSIKGVISGAAPATKSLIDKFRDKIGRDDVRIRQGYGMTESAPVTLFTRREIPESKMSSCGQVVPLTQAKVVDPDSGKILGAHRSGELLIRGPQVSGKMSCGQVLPSTQAVVKDLQTGSPVGPYQLGELCVRGPQVMSGYLKNAEATRETIDEEGWLHTGDVVYYDEDEYFFIVDRTKELIKVKGNQVSPTELENIIMELQEVADVAVVGIPDVLAGEIPRAFVVLRANAQLTEKQVADHVAPKVAKYKKLAGGVKFLDSIPRNPSGKILRQQLKVLGEKNSNK